MMKFKKSNYKFWHSPIVLLLLFCLLSFFSYKIIDLRKTEIETMNKKELVLVELDNLKKRQDILTTNIARLETAQGKEEIIRDKYQVAKPQEKMVIIVDKAPEVEQNQTDSKIDHSFWNFIKKLFKF